jgi:GNAT superfamily N-acetyltransferase
MAAPDGPWLEIAGAPPLPDLRFRHFRDDADLPAMIAVVDAAKAVDGFEQTRTPESLRASMAAMDAPDGNAKVLIAEVDGLVVGWCAGFEQGLRVDGVRSFGHDGFVRPDWRRHGVGGALLGASQARLRRLALARQAETGPVPVHLRAMVDEGERATVAMLAHDGYDRVRTVFDMVRPNLEALPDPTLPPGIDVRPARREDALAIFHAANEAMRDHWGWAPRSDERLVRSLEHPLMGQLDVWQVAWEGDQVVGGVLGYINAAENVEYGRRRGYTERIFTRRPWRGRGVAKALIARNLRQFAQRGMTEAALSVDAENGSGALRLYESVGFRAVHRAYLYERPLEL